MSLRPTLNDFLRTPWVAKTPFDDVPLGKLLPQQVHIAFRGTGPPSSRELVPLTPAAHELLYGPTRDSAQRVLRGMLATVDGVRGALELRGISLSNDQAGFAANLMVSNIESGFLKNSVRANDPAQFEHDVVKVAGPASTVARAQNTGWLDLGPRLSSEVQAVVRDGPRAGNRVASEVGQVLAHELQHSVSPQDPKGMDKRLVWLEEGSAEALSWWPTTAGRMMARMGVPAPPGHEPDPYTTSSDASASPEYHQYHRGVLTLLGLAGISSRTEDGRYDPAAHVRAQQLLQGSSIEQVPRNLARAIGRQHRLEPADVDALESLILDTGGRSADVAALADAVTRRQV